MPRRSLKVIVDIDVVKGFLHSQVYPSGTVYWFAIPSTTNGGATNWQHERDCRTRPETHWVYQ